jgi:hypothetical protein
MSRNVLDGVGSGSAGYTPGGARVGGANLTQATWFIDPTNGNDSNDGLVSGRALKSWAELAARWGFLGRLQQATNVFIVSSLSVDDPINLEIIPEGGTLNIYGGPTTTIGSGATALWTGTLSTVVAPVAATNTASTMKDIALTNWTAGLGARGRIVGGARDGNVFWPIRDLGGGLGAAQVRTSTPQTILGADDSVANGDSYQVETLVAVTPGALFTLPGKSGTATIVFRDIMIREPALFQTSWCPGGFVSFRGCILQAGVTLTTQGNGVIQFFNCLCNSPTFAAIEPRGKLNIFGGAFLATALLIENPAADVRTGTGTVSFQGIGGIEVVAGSFQSGAGLAVFDTTAETIGNPRGSALAVGIGVNGAGLPAVTLNGALWGTGCAGYGIDAAAGCSPSVTSANVTKLTNTGGLGAFALGGETATLRAFNDTTGVMTATIAATWANFQQTVAGGGFGGCAHNVQRNSHLVKQT